MRIAHAEGAPFAVSPMFDRIHNPPRGRDGGKAGKAGRICLASGRVLRGKGRQTVPAGEVLVLEMPGGGGIGDPHTREVARVLEDVRDGLVSRTAALREYGVVIRADGTLNEVATRARRRVALNGAVRPPRRRRRKKPVRR